MGSSYISNEIGNLFRVSFMNTRKILLSQFSKMLDQLDDTIDNFDIYMLENFFRS